MRLVRDTGACRAAPVCEEGRLRAGASDGRGCGRAAAVFSAFMLCSCAAAPAMMPRAGESVPLVGNTYSTILRPASEEPGRLLRGTLLSSWEGGTCTFERNSVSYYDIISGRRQSLRLDVKMEDGRALLCSADFTVIVAPERIAVAIGGDGILRGQEMLGIISGRFVPANSYEVSLRSIISEEGGVAAPRLVGGSLEITSLRGNRWTIGLSDPYQGWSSAGGGEHAF